MGEPLSGKWQRRNLEKVTARSEFGGRREGGRGKKKIENGYVRKEGNIDCSREKSDRKFTISKDMSREPEAIYRHVSFRAVCFDTRAHLETRTFHETVSP